MDDQAEALRLEINEFAKKARFKEIEALCMARRDDPNTDVAVRALLGLRTANFGVGRFAEAQDSVDKAVALARAHGSPQSLVDALCSAANLLSQNGKLDQELCVLAQEALTLAETHRYQRGIVDANASLGYAEAILGAKAKGGARLNYALTLAKKIGDRELESGVLGSLANFYYWTRRPAEALECGKRALMLNKQSGDDLERAIGLGNMAYYCFTSFREFRTYDQAVAYAQEGLALARELGYRYGEFGTLEGLSSCYLTSGQPDKALDVLQQALVLTREFANRSLEQRTLYNLGRTHSRLKQYDEALACLREQLALPMASTPTRWEVFAYYEKGNIYRKLGRHADALAFWQGALALEANVLGRHSHYYWNWAIIGMFTPYYTLRAWLTPKQPEPNPES